MYIAVKRSSASVVFLLIGIFAISAFSAVPNLMNYQGKLTDTDGISMADGAYNMRFSLFDAATGGNQLWNAPAPFGEEQSVAVSGGIYNVQLGAIVPLDSTFFTSNAIWLELVIYNTSTASWETMVPRQLITTVGYAFKAANSEQLEGMIPSDFATAVHEHDAAYVNEGQSASVSSSMIQDGATLSEIADDDGPGSGLNADYLDSLSESSFFRLNQNETLTGIPVFIGGTSGSQPPFSVDSTFVVKFLNADTVDNLHASSFSLSGHSHNTTYSLLGHTHGSLYFTKTESNSRFALLSHLHNSTYFTEAESDSRFINATGDSMSGSLEATYSSTLDYVFKGNGELGPTLGYLGVQGQTDFDGITTADWSGKEIGVAGISTGSSNADNYGIIGHSNYIGVRGEYSASPSTDYGELGRSSRGAVGKTSYSTGYGVEGVASNTGDYTNYGGHFTAAGDDGRGVYGSASGQSGRGVYGYATGLYGRGGYFDVTAQYAAGVYASNRYNSGTVSASLATSATGVIGFHSTGNYGHVGRETKGIYGTTSATNGHGVEGYASGSGSTGVYARSSASNGTGLYAQGGASGYAGHFRGKVKITDSSTNATVMELGSGLDYAEGFNVSEENMIMPGTVLSIDPDNPGKLKRCSTAYDTKVAGIVAGANGMGSGVRLGADQFDNDVALAGRVFCNVETTKSAIKAGDLLTTSDLPGYAMMAGDYNRTHGAILGKAMQSMKKGDKGQILVLVTLQ